MPTEEQKMANTAKLGEGATSNFSIRLHANYWFVEQGIVKLRSDKSETSRISSAGASPESVEEEANFPAFAPSRILVPVDFSKCSTAAVEHARALCRVFQARMTLLHVVEPAVHGDNYVTTVASLDPLNRNLVEMAREKLDQYARKTVGEGTRYDTLVRIGHAYSEIPDTAEALGAELIVVGTCGTSGVKTTLLGSTADRVVRHANCPVLTVRCTPPPYSLRHT
jgi:universal stress protein A